MNEQQSRAVIITSTFVLLASTTGASLTGQHKLPPNRTIVGGLFAMMGCAVLAEFSGQLGGYLAVAIGGTAFVLYGLPTLEQVFETKEEREHISGTPNKGPRQNTSGTATVTGHPVHLTPTGQLH